MWNRLRGLAPLALVAAALALVPPIVGRAQLAAVQTWAGTAGGTSTAITLSIHNVVALNDLLGVPIRFLPSGVAVGPTTLTVNLDGGGSLAATAVLRPTSNVGLKAPSGSEIATGVLTEVTYDGTQFVVSSPVDMTPVGHAVDLRQTSNTAPAGYLLEDGSCYSQTTYAPLFSVISTTYNAGSPLSCGAGTFAAPFSNGTVFAALDTQGVNGAAGRITSAGSGCDGTAIGTCGSQNRTVSTTYLPASGLSITGSLAGNINSGAFPAIAPANNSSATNVVVAGGTQPAYLANQFQQLSTSPVTVGGSTANMGTGQPLPTLNPLQLGRRAIKA